jgi:hypothetical protein
MTLTFLRSFSRISWISESDFPSIWIVLSVPANLPQNHPIKGKDIKSASANITPRNDRITPYIIGRRLNRNTIIDAIAPLKMIGKEYAQSSGPISTIKIARVIANQIINKPTVCPLSLFKIVFLISPVLPTFLGILKTSPQIT